jgi:hypothetical protein
MTTAKTTMEIGATYSEGINGNDRSIFASHMRPMIRRMLNSDSSTS